MGKSKHSMSHFVSKHPNLDLKFRHNEQTKCMPDPHDLPFYLFSKDILIWAFCCARKCFLITTANQFQVFTRNYCLNFLFTSLQPLHPPLLTPFGQKTDFHLLFLKTGSKNSKRISASSTRIIMKWAFWVPPRPNQFGQKSNFASFISKACQRQTSS